MSIDETYNFRRIDERLTTSGLVSAAQLRELRNEGYDAVVNLLPDSHDGAVTDEVRIVQGQGLDYVHIPVDFDAPTHEDFVAFARTMDARADQKVHVHCAANWRVSAFYAVYAQQRGRCTEDEADHLVRELWDPSEFPVWTTFIAEERARPLP